MVLLSALLSMPALAATCTYDPGRGPITKTLPLVTANISVGADVAIGSVIHLQRISGVNDAAYPVIRCSTDGGGTFTVDQHVSLVSPGALVPGWSGVYAGALYQTSLPGIGVAFTNSDGQNTGSAFTSSPLFKWSFDVVDGVTFYPPIRDVVTLVFIKTGPVSAGVINGAQLPTSVLNLSSTTAVTGLPSTAFRLNFSGVINVTVSSCQTPDMNVPMGSYSLDRYFNGKETATPWVPFNIRLLNCPAFFGNYTAASNPPISYLEGTSSAGTRIFNSVVTSISPTYGAFDSGQGIINLDGAKDSAQGVGIQLASGPAQSSFPGILDLSIPLRIPVYSTEVSEKTIPLMARYVATSGTVTPGPANSKVVFTINYY